AACVHNELVVGPFGTLDGDCGRQPGHGEAVSAAGDLDVVGVVGAVDDYSIGLAVADAAARGRRQVEVDLSYIRVGQVVDGDVVGAAQGGEVDLLDAVEVHSHVADVAEEAHSLAVGGDIDVLVDVGPDEAHRIVAALAFDHVAAVARVP